MRNTHPKSVKKEDVIRIIKEYSEKKGAIIILDEDVFLKDTDNWYSWDPKNKILNLNTEVIINEGYKKDLFEIIRNFFDSNVGFKDLSIRPTVKSYEEYYDQSPDKELLNFFKSNIPFDDWMALKMSLFLRFQDKKGKPIAYLKEDITSKYGTRGANIANLCTIDFFEDEFKPLFNQLEVPKFKEYYEHVVGERAKVLFVSSKHDLEALTDAFLKTLNKCKTHGIRSFKMYARASQNISVLKKFVALLDAKKDENFTQDILFEEFSVVKVLEDSEIPTVAFEVKLTKYIK